MSLGGLRDPSNPESRHVLAARGRRRRLRGLEGRARRGRGRKQRSVAGRAVAVRELAGGSAARARRQRRRARRLGARLLEPRRSSTTSPRRARTSSRRSRSTSPAASRVPRAGLLAVRPEEYRSADGTSFAAPQVTAAAATALATRSCARPGDDAARAQCGRRVRPDGCRRCAAGRDAFTGSGTLDQTAALGLWTRRCPRPTTSRTTTPATAHPLFGTWRRRLVARRSTTGTTRTTSTRLSARGTPAGRSVDGDGGDLSLALWRPGRSRCSSKANGGASGCRPVRARRSTWATAPSGRLVLPAGAPRRSGRTPYRLVVVRT